MKPHPTQTLIEDAAIAWLTERDDGFSPAREREFAQWLRADARHAATVARLEQTLGLLRELPEFRSEINTAFARGAPVVPFSAGVPAVAPFRAPRRRPRLMAWAAAAAAVLFMAAVGWRVMQRPVEARYTTTVAGYERAKLDDGSTLELNAASAVRVQFTTAERRVQLESGEAHFAVAHDTARPFIVSAGAVSVRAVGTAFNVRLAASGDVEVIVIEGKVRVGPGGADATEAAAGPLVAAGERIQIPRQAPALVVERVPPAVLRQSLAWQSRLVEFAEVPLAEVVSRFNARNRLQLLLAEPALGERRIGGTFALDEPEAFVRLLERDGEIVAQRRGEDEMVLGRAR